MPTARVVGAFHHVAAASLWSDEKFLSHEDVLVCGDDDEAKSVTAELPERQRRVLELVADGVAERYA